MVTYLVTGGAGFIGSNFIQYLYEKYGEEIQVINLDLLTYAGNTKNLKEVENYPSYGFVKGDICDRDLVTGIMAAYDIDFIVHFAAESHVDRSIQDANVFVSTNICGTLNLLDCAKKAWATDNGFKADKRFLYVSTDEVYGTLGNEGYFTEDSPINPRNPYAVSKASADMLTKAYFDTYGFPVLRSRCSNNYGPNQFTEKLIPYFITKALHQEKLPVYGDGMAIRDWLYVKDHCSALDLILTKGEIGCLYNIGDHNEKTTQEIAEIIVKELKDTFNYNIPSDFIAYVPDRKGHDRRYAIDSNRLRTELGWYPKTTFEKGIKETLRWYIKRLTA